MNSSQLNPPKGKLHEKIQRYLQEVFFPGSQLWYVKDPAINEDLWQFEAKDPEVQCTQGERGVLSADWLTLLAAEPLLRPGGGVRQGGR